MFTYDDQSRLIAVQDALGNVTQMVYDGQNHLVQTISPLNETNQFFYDSSNNLIRTVDPLGFTNTLCLRCEQQSHRAIDRWATATPLAKLTPEPDRLRQNGNEWIGQLFITNTNGTMYTHQYRRSNVTISYDDYGQLNSIAYAGSLGIEILNNAFGDPTTHTNARGFITTYGYNQRGGLKM